MFADDVKTRIMNSKGEYEKVENKKNLIAQDKFIQMAIDKAKEKNKENKSQIIPNHIKNNKENIYEKENKTLFER